MVKVALISGSLRKDSFSTKIAKNVGRTTPRRISKRNW